MRSFPLLRPSILLGSSIWLVLSLASFTSHARLGIIEVLFLAGPWIVVPLGADLLRGAVDIEGAEIRQVRDWLLFAAALLTTISFFLDNRIAAAWLASAWLLVCAVFAADGVRRLFTYSAKSFTQFCFAGGELYLLVASLWLVASRAGNQLLSFQEPIVLLTGVHFHFAGFASSVLAGLTYQRLRDSRLRLALQVALGAVVCGPGILGLAFLLGPKWKLAAALLITVGQLALAAGMVYIGAAAGPVRGRWLFFVAGASVAVGMVFALVWAIGEYPLQEFVNIRQMAEFHGVLNAIGFVVCGLMGWKMIRFK
jgi:hypothetical protein